jgi:hypothetical protein
MKRIFGTLALAAGLAGGLAACGGSSTTPGPPCCAPPTSSPPTSPTASPSPALTAGANQSVTFNHENLAIGTDPNAVNGVNSVTWTNGQIVEAPYVMLTNQGLDPDPAVTSTDPNTPVKVYPLGGSAAAGPDAGSGSWFPNPDFQWVSVYATIKNNGPVGPPIKDPVTGLPKGVAVPEISLWWVTANGTASAVGGSLDGGNAVTSALGIQTNNDLLGIGTSPDGNADANIIKPANSESGAYAISVPAGPGQLQIRDSSGRTELVIPVP